MIDPIHIQKCKMLKQEIAEQGRKFKICSDGTLTEVKRLLKDPSPYVRMLATERINAPIIIPVTEKQVKRRMRYIKAKEKNGNVDSIAKGWSNTALYKMWKSAKYEKILSKEWSNLETVIEWALERGLVKDRDSLFLIKRSEKLGPTNCAIRIKRKIRRKQK